MDQQPLEPWYRMPWQYWVLTGVLAVIPVWAVVSDWGWWRAA